MARPTQTQCLVSVRHGRFQWSRSTLPLTERPLHRAACLPSSPHLLLLAPLPPPPLILLALFSLRHRQAFICPSCARSLFLALSLSLSGLTLFFTGMAVTIFAGTHAHTHMQRTEGGKKEADLEKPAKYFIHGRPYRSASLNADLTLSPNSFQPSFLFIYLFSG